MNNNKGGEDMVDWMSVAQLSKTLEFPETTTLRYLNSFEEFFLWEQVDRERKYDPDSIEILQRIYMLYDTDHETIEIKKILADEYAFTVNDSEHYTTTNPLVHDISGESDRIIEKSFKGTFFSTIVFVGGGIAFFWVLLFLFFTSRLLGG